MLSLSLSLSISFEKEENVCALSNPSPPVFSLRQLITSVGPCPCRRQLNCGHKSHKQTRTSLPKCHSSSALFIYLQQQWQCRILATDRLSAQLQTSKQFGPIRAQLAPIKPPLMLMIIFFLHWPSLDSPGGVSCTAVLRRDRVSKSKRYSHGTCKSNQIKLDGRSGGEGGRMPSSRVLSVCRRSEGCCCAKGSRAL